MTRHTLTGAGDLAMDGELRPYIRTQVEFVRHTKAGLAYCRTHDGKMVSVPFSNLEPRPDRPEDKPQWPTVPLPESVKLPLDVHGATAYAAEYPCEPQPDPWVAAGWTLDKRGKPCKWKDEFHISDVALATAKASPATFIEHQERAAQAKQRCLAAMQMIEASPEIFVVLVTPEQIIEKDDFHGGVNVVTRCRVRWCENEEIAGRYATFQEHVMAEVDREQTRIIQTGELNGRR